MEQKTYSYEQTIRKYRKLRGVSSDALGAQLGGKSGSYIRGLESPTSKTKIRDVRELRRFAAILDIPLEEFGLSLYDPFHPEHLPAQGEILVQATIDSLSMMLGNFWTMRASQIPLSILANQVQGLLTLFGTIRQYATMINGPLSKRYLQLLGNTHAAHAVLMVEQKNFRGAIAAYKEMEQVALQHGDAGFIAHAVMNRGVEQERDGQHQEAVDSLEYALDVAKDAKMAWLPLLYSYAARCYASNGQYPAFIHAITQAEKYAPCLRDQEPDDGINYSVSGICAEWSYGLVALGRYDEALAIRSQMEEQIAKDHNRKLKMWYELDLARIGAGKKNIEEGVSHILTFYHEAKALGSDQPILRAQEYMQKLIVKYPDVRVVQDAYQTVYA